MTMIECCRLCFSESDLLSMFSGKSRSIRNSLRKMIEYTVNVQIEPDDCMVDICFNCCVDVSNFYLFKLSCTQSEEKLKTSNLLSKKKAKKLKLDILNLKEVPLPTVELSKEVMNWLGTKRIQLSETETESKTNKVEKGIQTDKQDFSEIASQTDVLKTVCSQSQTSPVHLTDVAVQFNSNSSTKKSRSCQTKSELLQPTKSIRKKDVYVQCQLQSPSKLEDRVPEKLDRDSQTEVVECLNQESQCNLLKLNGYKHFLSPVKTLGSPDQIYKELSQSELYPQDPYQRDVDSNLQITISFLDKIKQEKLSPHEKPIVSTLSPIASPSSCGLLKSKKSVNMSICRWCDKALYKNEIPRHRKTHMNCKFCKRKFLSYRDTKKHMAECMLWRENAVIRLEKVDVNNDPHIRNLYKTALEKLNG